MKRPAASKITRSISLSISFFDCNQNNPEMRFENKQPTASRPLAQRGEIPNVSHIKSSGDGIRAAEGGQEEEKSGCA